MLTLYSLSTPKHCVYSYEMLLHSIPLSAGQIVTVERIQDPIKMFQGIGNYFFSLVSSEIPPLSPASSIFAFQRRSRSGLLRSPRAHHPQICLISSQNPLRSQYLQLPTEGSPWGWGRGSSVAFLLPDPSLCWETGNGISQVTSKVPASDHLPGPRFPQLNDACL